MRELRIEPAVPLDVRSDADRNAEREHLEHAAERVALATHLFDQLDHARLGLLVQAAQRRRIDPVEVLRADDDVVRSLDGADLKDVRQHVDPQGGEESFADRTDCDARRSLARAGALEDRASLIEAELLHPGEIRVTGPRTG